MEDNRKIFKMPPKRFQPRGLHVLYEDHDILVVDKANYILSVGTDQIKENTAFYQLTSYIRKGNVKSRNRLYVVHALGKNISGVLLFAKNEKAKLFLRNEWDNFKKTYCAVLHGNLPEKEGLIVSTLAENKLHKMYSLKELNNDNLAKTKYKVLKESLLYSLVNIELYTRRKHQICTHFSEKGFPVVGDKIYGDNDKTANRLLLHAETLTILHPFTKKKMVFTSKIPAFFKAILYKK